jgi:hypothetical protein
MAGPISVNLYYNRSSTVLSTDIRLGLAIFMPTLHKGNQLGHEKEREKKSSHELKDGRNIGPRKPCYSSSYASTFIVYVILLTMARLLPLTGYVNSQCR